MLDKKYKEYFKDIKKDYLDISKHCIKTETRDLGWIRRISDMDVCAKLENNQITGSFKFRGAYNKLNNIGLKRKIITASAGNHGLAVAEVSKILKKDATICIPSNTSNLKKERILSYGHSVVLIGSQLDDSTEYAKRISKEKRLEFISPYNDELVVKGQATATLEFLEQNPDMEILVIPVGGGGLISGAAIVAKNINPNIKIIGVQPESYPSVYKSLKEHKVSKVNNYPTLADGLAVNLEEDTVTLDIMDNLVDEVVLVNEEEIAAATLSLLYHESLLVEPSGAVGLAAIISGKIKNSEGKKIGTILSGGNVTTGNLNKIINYPFKDERLFDYTNIYAEKKEYKDILRGFDLSFSRKSIKNVNKNSQEQDVKEDILYLEARFKDISLRLEDVKNKLKEYINYSNKENLVISEVSIRSINDILEKVEFILKTDCSISLGIKDNPSEYGRKISKYLGIYRTLVHLLMQCYMTLDWRSASYKQSTESMFFTLDRQDNPGVNYNRYESFSVNRIENQLAGILGINQKETNILLTSSGMAAYTLLESYLIRYVLKKGDNILIPHYIYFETDEQISSLSEFGLIRDNAHDSKEIANLVKRYKPSLLFLDPLTNNQEPPATFEVGQQLIKIVVYEEIQTFKF